MNRLDNEENVKLKVSSLIILFNLQHALSSVRESKRFLQLLLFDESRMFCRLVCARQQIHLYVSIARMLAYHKMAHEANNFSLFKYEVAIAP